MRDTRYNQYNPDTVGYNKKYAQMWDSHVIGCFNKIQMQTNTEYDTMIHVVDKYIRQLERTCKTQRGIKMPAILRYKEKEAKE